MAFLSRYRTLRKSAPEGLDEIEFNFGRAFHQLGKRRPVISKTHHADLISLYLSKVCIPMPHSIMSGFWKWQKPNRRSWVAIHLVQGSYWGFITGWLSCPGGCIQLGSDLYSDRGDSFGWSDLSSMAFLIGTFVDSSCCVHSFKFVCIPSILCVLELIWYWYLIVVVQFWMLYSDTLIIAVLTILSHPI